MEGDVAVRRMPLGWVERVETLAVVAREPLGWVEPVREVGVGGPAWVDAECVDPADGALMAGGIPRGLPAATGCGRGREGPSQSGGYQSRSGPNFVTPSLSWLTRT